MRKVFEICYVKISYDKEDDDIVVENFGGDYPFDVEDKIALLVTKMINKLISDDLEELVESIRDIYLTVGLHSLCPISLDYIMNENTVCYLDEEGFERNIDYLLDDKKLGAAYSLLRQVNIFRPRSATTCRIIENMINCLRLRDDRLNDLNKRLVEQDADEE